MTSERRALAVRLLAAGALAGAGLLAGAPAAHAAAASHLAQGEANARAGSDVVRTAPDATDGDEAATDGGETPSAGERGSLFGSVQAESGSDAPSGEDKSVENRTDEEPPFGMRPWIVWSAAAGTVLLVGIGVVVAATSAPRRSTSHRG
ncbi:hypothetical protein CZ771_07360 [Actinomycetales bacterium JB111]|nr:hypothetical protein CZ771_07360 [Actinomycetales bacterium JB111]